MYSNQYPVYTYPVVVPPTINLTLSKDCEVFYPAKYYYVNGVQYLVPEVNLTVKKISKEKNSYEKISKEKNSSEKGFRQTGFRQRQFKTDCQDIGKTKKKFTELIGKLEDNLTDDLTFRPLKNKLPKGIDKNKDKNKPTMSDKEQFVEIFSKLIGGKPSDGKTEIKVGVIDLTATDQINPNSSELLDFLAGGKLKKKSSKTFETTEEFKLEDDVELIPFEIKQLEDLVKLGNLYDETKPSQFGFNMKQLNKICPALQSIVNIVGMKKVKKDIFNKVIVYLQGLGSSKDMNHVAIMGPPGYGKTMLSFHLAEVFYGLGLIKKKKSSEKYFHPISGKQIEFPFIIAKREDLIAKYLGQTSHKVKKIIESSLGGVLVIDEAYSLGSTSGDSYSEECINRINQALSEHAGEFICVIAGYEEDLKKNFFINPGLERRFRTIFKIDEYSHEELGEIFKLMVGKAEWEIIANNDKLNEFMKENKDSFKFCGGDMENLLYNVRISHSMRVMGKSGKEKKKITIEDIREGYKVFMEGREKKEDKHHFYYM